MQLDWFTFIAQIVNFAILIVLLKRFLYEPVVQAMDRREEQIRSRVEDARNMMSEAEMKRDEYEQKIKIFENRKEEMSGQAKKEVEQARKEMLNRARNEVKDLQERWKTALEDEQKAFIQELYLESGERIVGIIRNILSDLSNQNLEEQVTEIFMDRLSAMNRNEKNSMVRSALDYGDGIIVVNSSIKLKENSQKRIREILREKSVPGINCRFDVVPSLRLGVELNAGGWKISWNLDSYLHRLKEQMVKHFQEQSRDRATAEF